MRVAVDLLQLHAGVEVHRDHDVVAAALVTLLAWPAKNAVEFGFFGYSSWRGVNLVRGLPIDRETMVFDDPVPAELQHEELLLDQQLVVRHDILARQRAVDAPQDTSGRGGPPHLLARQHRRLESRCGNCPRPRGHHCSAVPPGLPADGCFCYLQSQTQMLLLAHPLHGPEPPAWRLLAGSCP